MAAREDETTAAGLKTAAETAQQLVANLGEQVETVRQCAEAARQALSPYLVRPPGAKTWYLVRMLALFGGDVAAVTGACVLLGEIPALAATLALSTGAAAVIGGLAGGEVKRLRLARERQTSADELPEHLRPWQQLFSGAQDGQGVVKIMALVTVLILLSLGVGVVALRWSLDGLLAGVAFGTFSLAIGLASLWNSYDYADDVADILDAADKACHKAAGQYRKAAASPPLARYLTATTAAASIQAEQAARGKAAGHRIRASLFAVLIRHPHIVGHGEAPEPAPATLAVAPARPVVPAVAAVAPAATKAASTATVVAGPTVAASRGSAARPARRHAAQAKPAGRTGKAAV
jgi:hypothetical protein